MDMLAKKEELLPIIDAYRKEMDFEQIIPISAFKGEGTKEVLDAIENFMADDLTFMEIPDSHNSQL